MEDFKVIETCYSNLKKSNNSKNLKDLASVLSKHFKRNITTFITPTKKGNDVFVMSVTPQISTIDKVLQYMSGTESKLKVISDIWHSCNDWRLDIDNQVLGLLNPSELTALTLHEMKHIMDTDRVPERLVNVVQFGVATSKISQKAMLMNQGVQKILEIPVISACQTFFDKDRTRAELKAERRAMEKEMRADGYAKENGYLNALMSAMDKLERHIKKGNSVDKNMKDALDYSMRIIDNLEVRKDALVKDQFMGLRKFLPDSMLKESVEEIYEEWFPNDILNHYFVESFDGCVEDAYFTEFGIGPKLAPIEQNQLDYIAVRIETMETVNDKMMILSYINSKLELANYYMEILSDKKLSKKYKVPHTLNQLEIIHTYLEKLRERALNTLINKNDKNIIVYYPAGYEG